MREAVSEFLEDVAPVGAVPEDLEGIVNSVVEGQGMPAPPEASDDIEHLEDLEVLADAYSNLNERYQELIRQLGIDPRSVLMHRLMYSGDVILQQLPY